MHLLDSGHEDRRETLRVRGVYMHGGRSYGYCVYIEESSLIAVLKQEFL